MRKWLIASAVLLAALAITVGVGFQTHLLPIADIRPLPRAANGVDYVLYVRAPAACTPAHPCAAAYVLDGAAWTGQFEHAADVAAQAGRAQPIVIVGVGYVDIAGTAWRRKRDFTPNFGQTDSAPSTHATGGAAAFLHVLRDEIIPYAESHYPIDPRCRGLIAHSYAGLFAAYTLKRTPDLFDRYLIISPALWFDNYHVFQEQPAPTQPTTIALASDAKTQGVSHMARDVERYGDMLSGNAAFSASVHLYPGATHMSVVPLAFTDAIPLLYSTNRDGPCGASRK